MKPKTNQSPESVVREIKRKTRRKFNSEEKIRIILEGLKGEESLPLCRRGGIAQTMWEQSVSGGTQARLQGDTPESSTPRGG